MVLEPSGTCKANSPISFVWTASEVPLIMMLTPGIGKPSFASTTLPVIVRITCLTTISLLIDAEAMELIDVTPNRFSAL
ncbi:hypothetical protein D3C87_1915960 [compost metagenome]